jgi:serine/threonine-protein kinase
VAIALRALALVRLWNRSHASTADERNALGDRAVQAVTDAVARAPHLADTHLADALIADYSGDVAYAVRALRRAHDIEPLHAFSHEVLGRIELEGCVSGVDRLLLAHELDPRHLGALVIVARERFLVGRDDEAEAFLRRFDAGHGGPKLETLALRLRRRLWRRDRIGVQPLVDSRGRPLPAVLAFLNDCVSALHGELSTAALVERAARAAEETMSPKRKCFVLQIAVEGLAAVSSADALRHLLSAAELPLADLRWLDECPALEPLRASTAFIAARNVVKARIDDAFYGAAPARPAIRAEVTATEVDPRPPSPVASPTGSTVEHSAVDHGAPTMVIGNRRRPLRTLPTIVDNPPD